MKDGRWRWWHSRGDINVESRSMQTQTWRQWMQTKCRPTLSLRLSKLQAELLEVTMAEPSPRSSAARCHVHSQGHFDTPTCSINLKGGIYNTSPNHVYTTTPAGAHRSMCRLAHLGHHEGRQRFGQCHHRSELDESELTVDTEFSGTLLGFDDFVSKSNHLDPWGFCTRTDSRHRHGSRGCD